MPLCLFKKRAYGLFHHTVRLLLDHLVKHLEYLGTGRFNVMHHLFYRLFGADRLIARTLFGQTIGLGMDDGVRLVKCGVGCGLRELHFTFAALIPVAKSATVMVGLFEVVLLAK